MKYKIARMSILGIEWYYPRSSNLITDWTFSGHTLDHRFSSLKDAVIVAKEMLIKEKESESPHAIFIATWKDDRWKFTEVKP